MQCDLLSHTQGGKKKEKKNDTLRQWKYVKSTLSSCHYMHSELKHALNQSRILRHDNEQMAKENISRTLRYENEQMDKENENRTFKIRK